MATAMTGRGLWKFACFSLLMLLSAGDLELLAGVGSILQGAGLEAFAQMAQEYDLPYTEDGSRLTILLK